jgi:hypothetical protein
MTKKRRRIDKAAWEVTIDRLRADLETEKLKNRRLINEKNAELERVWRLVPVNFVVLLHEMPSLKKLLLLVGEAIGLADPLRGAPIEDTMRTQFVHVGENASTSATEAGATHNRDRANLYEIERRLRNVTDELGRLLKARETEYHPPHGRCEECGKLLFQNETGRPRIYCSDKCQKRAVRKRPETTTADIIR